ncbi:ribosomal RNA small subunit methyltransferase A [Candidatus Micrarchaeota archaeon]|nr:ribosomal RNA small subunit methyltransferase A [Candidatus Micrarchaeota archaeon]MBU1930644.1 ribosomal RNA small subunit methyltransferase A [Candidatus Micrarchaeota archaeon]
MSLVAELNEFMVKYRFKPNKKLSQHFLVNSPMIQKIVQAADLKKNDVVLEVGAGTGFLTRELQKHCKKVIAIEKDPLLFELLEKELSPKNLELIQGDALKVKWPAFSKMVSLPPYNISSDLVYRLFEHDFEKACIVFQREFVEKLSAEPGFLDFNALSAMTQYHTIPNQLFLVSNQCFFPKPPGFSALIELKKKKRYGTAQNDAVFRLFIKQLFRHKNKSISNSLKLALPFLKKELKISEPKAKEILDNFSFSAEKTCALEITLFVELFNALYKNA